MRKLILLSLLLFTGCATYHPVTALGGRCKQQCAMTIGAGDNPTPWMLGQCYDACRVQERGQ